MTSGRSSESTTPLSYRIHSSEISGELASINTSRVYKDTSGSYVPYQTFRNEIMEWKRVPWYPEERGTEMQSSQGFIKDTRHKFANAEYAESVCSSFCQGNCASTTQHSGMSAPEWCHQPPNLSPDCTPNFRWNNMIQHTRLTASLFDPILSPPLKATSSVAQQRESEVFLTVLPCLLMDLFLKS